jgi:CHAT domain-containing protein
MLRPALIVFVLALATLGPSAHARCYPNGRPTLPPNPVTLQERFDALLPFDEHDENGVTAVKKWRKLIADEETAPHPSAERLSRGYAWLGGALGEGDHVAEGLAAAEKAESVIQANGLDNAPFHSEVLAELSIKETNAGKSGPGYQHALRASEIALQHYGRLSIEYEQAESSAGSAAHAAGRYIDSNRHLAAALEASIGCRPASSITLQTLRFSHGVTLEQAGQVEAALEEKRLALDWAVRNLPIESDLLSNNFDSYGITLRNLGRLSESEALLRQAVDLQVKYNPELVRDRARATMHLAAVLHEQGNDDGAEALWLAAFALHQKTPDRSNPTAGSIPYRKAADAAEARGDFALAIERRRAAIADMAPYAPPTHPELARAHLELAATLAATGHARDALPEATAAIETIRKSYRDSDPRRVLSELLFAKIIAAAEGDAAGYAIAAPFILPLETRLMDATMSRVELIKYGPVFSASFATFAGLALATAREEEAFHALQLANLTDIVLVNSEVAARSAATNPATATLVRSLQDHVRLRQGLDAERSFAASSKNGDQLHQLDARIKINDAQIATEGAEIDRLFPAYRALGRPAPVTLAAVRAGLRPNQILLAPLPLEDGTLAIAVTRDGMTWVKNTATRAQIVALVNRIRTSIEAAQHSIETAPPFDVAAAEALYQIVAPPKIAVLLKTRPEILYYNAGALASVPPALLVAKPSRGLALAKVHWLVRTHAITVLPTLSTRADPAVKAPALAVRFLGVGAPELGPAPVELAARGLGYRGGGIDAKVLRALPSLPRALSELRAIGTALGGADDKLLAAGGATEASLRALPLDRYSVIAFATHGLVGGDFAGLSEPALVLTPPAKPTGDDDGLLTASEIAGLRLNADWVILSACNSAGGSSAGGPAYGGLASAFMQAGARALLVSHWPVRDDAAEAITVATVRATAQGMPRARALQQAMIGLLTSSRVPQAGHPAIWAPFVLLDR